MSDKYNYKCFACFQPSEFYDEITFMYLFTKQCKKLNYYRIFQNKGHTWVDRFYTKYVKLPF